MDWKKGVMYGLLAVDLVAVNAGVGYLIFKSQFSIFNFQSNSPAEQGPALQDNTKTSSDSFVEISELSNKITVLEQKMASVAAGQKWPTSEPTLKPVKVAVPTQAKVRTTQYVTVPGSGSSSRNDWETLPGTEFYFDTADYPGLLEIYFEVNMKLFNGNGKAYVQLLDSTHGIGVQGSDVSTNSQTNTVAVSGKVTFWAGKNLIKVQAKSLTADTAVYNSGRLRIVTLN